MARYDGRVVFVRHALPGERVQAVVTDERRRYLRADAVEVLRAAPGRVPPPCPYAGPGRCGGCDWQHADLATQRDLKASVVREQLARLARVDRDVVVEDVPGAPDGLGWRTRVRFAVRAGGAAGLLRHRSHEVEPVERCLIAHPLVEEAGIEGRVWPGVRAVEVAAAVASGQRQVSVDDAVVEGPPALTERAAGRDWQVSAGGFWQVHPAAADTLVAAVLDQVQPAEGERVWDLYAGVGLFAGALATRVGPGGRVTAVESHPAAVRDARVNLGGLGQVAVRRARVDARTVARLPRPDVVVLDPPRAGAGPDVMAAISAAAPRTVCYVACDPAALARDVAAAERSGYRLTALRAFDLFPMTAHVECVARLEPGQAPASG